MNLLRSNEIAPGIERGANLGNIGARRITTRRRLAIMFFQLRLIIIRHAKNHR